MVKVPRWLPAVATTLVLAGSGVAAAAVTSGSGGLDVAEEPTTTVPTDPVTTTTTQPGADDPAGDLPADGSSSDPARYWGPECGDNPTNHGGYVSRADKDGESRSEAAHSPCGKPLSSVDVTTTSTSSPGDDSTDDSTQPATQQTAGPGHDAGNRHGHGSGKGHRP